MLKKYVTNSLGISPTLKINEMSNKLVEKGKQILKITAFLKI